MFESENSFSHVTLIIVNILLTANFVSTKSIFSIFLPNFAFLVQNHVALLKDNGFARKCFYKKANTHHLFFTKLEAQIIFSL